MEKTVLANFVDGECRKSSTGDYLEVHNPATADILVEVPLSPPAEVDRADQAAAAAESWRRVPPPERVQHLFKLKTLLEEHLDALSRSITMENGKTFGEAAG